VRFPFTFIGVLALGMGVWVGFYTIQHPVRDGVTLAMEIFSGVLLIGFGSYVIYRRLARGSAV
jgi:putative Mn2+ efflux pump MntP